MFRVRSLPMCASLVAAVALCLACGGGATATEPDSLPPPAVPTDAGARSTVAAASAPTSASRFCGDWGGLAAQSAKLSGAQGGSSTDLKSNVDATNAYLKALADNAPSDVRRDFEVYAKSWSAFAEGMAKANYDAMKMATDPDLQNAMQAMADPQLQQATANIAGWIQRNCTSR